MKLVFGEPWILRKVHRPAGYGAPGKSKHCLQRMAQQKTQGQIRAIQADVNVSTVRRVSRSISYAVWLSRTCLSWEPSRIYRTHHDQLRKNILKDRDAAGQINEVRLEATMLAREAADPLKRVATGPDARLLKVDVKYKNSRNRTNLDVFRSLALR